jgi:imidazolonepropionase-like amidohydrolase
VIDEDVESRRTDPLTPEQRKRLDAFVQGTYDEITIAKSMGVKIALGFDASEKGMHGKNATELASMVKRGLTPVEAIQAATINAAELLSWQDRVGAIEPGKFADLIAVVGDPLNDITVLQNVIFVMKGGEVVKDDGRP